MVSYHCSYLYICVYETRVQFLFTCACVYERKDYVME